MSDAAAFLGSYKETLAEKVLSGVWPPELAEIYEPESCLKHSDTKEVYLVVDKRTGARVVLRASSLDAGEQVDAEHAILSRLDYPGVPKTYGTYTKDGRSYLAREYFDGEPLDQVIARGVMQPPQVYCIARQICSILGYLHAQNPPVIHRDIKPQNIIMHPDGSLGLTDFGIARTYKEDSVSDTQYMGTLLYAPPEQYGYAQSSPQTDIYALGIVLIYLATGSPDRRNLAKRIKDTQLRSLIEKCIAFDPKNRFQNVEQIIRRINAMKTRKLRLVVGVLAACAILILLGISIWFLISIVLGGGSAESSGQEGLIDAASLTGQIANGDYSSTNDPRIGSTNWLFDYNNDGNLQGNINCGGFAVAADYGETIYVASNNTIYKLDKEGSILEKIYSGSVEGSLNIYNGYLYFPEYNGTIHQIDLRTNKESTVGMMSAESLYFSEGRMYYTELLDELNLYTAKTDGSSLALVSNATQAHYTNIANGIRYYSDGTDGYRIYAQSLTTGQTALIYDSPAHWLSVCNGRIYFEDEKPGYVASIKLDGSDYQVVYEQPCWYLNATPHGVFAINALTKELIVVDSSNGKSQVVLDRGDVQYCLVPGWIFYRSPYSDTVLGMMRENGSDHREFEPESI